MKIFFQRLEFWFHEGLAGTGGGRVLLDLHIWIVYIFANINDIDLTPIFMILTLLHFKKIEYWSYWHWPCKRKLRKWEVQRQNEIKTPNLTPQTWNPNLMEIEIVIGRSFCAWLFVVLIFIPRIARGRRLFSKKTILDPSQ